MDTMIGPNTTAQGLGRALGHQDSESSSSEEEDLFTPERPTSW